MSFLPFFTEPDWGLPLAIAANLHVPYRIKLGVDNLDAVHVKDHDKKGKSTVCYFVVFGFPFCSYAFIYCET